MASEIKIDTERCKGCGLCVAVCPQNSLVVSKHSNKAGYFPAEKKYPECTGCAMCAIVCAETCIQVYCDSKIITIESGKKGSSSLTKDKV